MQVFWFIPTHGDSRYLGTAEGARPLSHDYVKQVAIAADSLGYEGVLIPTGRSCEDPWVVASSLIPVTKRLRACSKSFEQEHQECQVDELQAGVEPSLAVLPQPPVLVQPGKAAFHDPALGHHFESVKLASLGDLHRHMPSQNLLHALRERPTDVACIAQQAL